MSKTLIVKRPISAAASVLSYLFKPLAEEMFFQDIWEQRFEWWRIAASPRWLLGTADLGKLLTTERPEGTKPATLGRMLEGRYQQRSIPEASRPIDRSAHRAVLFRAWQDGFTLIVPELHRFWLPAILFSDRLHQQTGLRAELNLYYTPPEAITFPFHYDTHDVLILQLFGVKRWRLYPSPAYLPYLEEHFQNSPWADAPPEAPKAVFELASGHALYLPRGIIHAAETERLPSLHISIGLYPKLWRDVVTSHANIDEMLLRQGVSPAYHRDPMPMNAPRALRPFLPQASCRSACS